MRQRTPQYNGGMARGWESKSVKAQIEAARTATHHGPASGPDPAYLDLLRRKETLVLSQTRIKRELESSQNVRYRQMLSSALADLNTQLSDLARKVAARDALA